MVRLYTGGNAPPKKLQDAISIHTYYYYDFLLLFKYGFILVANIDHGHLIEVSDFETFTNLHARNIDPLYLKLFYKKSGKDKELCIPLEYVNTDPYGFSSNLATRERGNENCTVPELLYFRGSISIAMKKELEKFVNR